MVSSEVVIRRIKTAGRCVVHQEGEASKLTLWQPLHGRRTVGTRRIFYVYALLYYTGLDHVNELQTAMIHKAT